MRAVGKGMAAGSLAVLMLLAACSRGEPELMNIGRGQTTPDEFAVLPNKPIEIPEDLETASLPAPTPGGRNLVDPTPNADAVAALGGNPALVARSGQIRASEGGLVQHASRYGVRPAIRQELAAADREFRRGKRGRPLERLFNVNVYYRAYEDQQLDKYRELNRWRARGVRTPAVPPEPVE